MSRIREILLSIAVIFLAALFGIALYESVVNAPNLQAGAYRNYLRAILVGAALASAVGALLLKRRAGQAASLRRQGAGLMQIDLYALGALQSTPKSAFRRSANQSETQRERPVGARNLPEWRRRQADTLVMLGRRNVLHLLVETRPMRFIVETSRPSKVETVQQVVQRALGAGRQGLPENALANTIEVEPLFPGASLAEQRYKLANFYIVTFQVAERSLARALSNTGSFYDIAYALKEASGDRGKERLFRHVSPDVPYANMAGISTLSSFECGVGRGRAPKDRAWSLRATGFDRLVTGASQCGTTTDGSGVVIAHLDTGWTNHPQLNLNRYDLANAFDTVGPLEGGDGRDPLTPEGVEQAPGLFNPGHGTATASVINSLGGVTERVPGTLGEDGLDSSGGTTPDGSDDITVTGVAQGATILPVRCIQGVVLEIGRTIDLSQAIWHAIDKGADVITMSLGGPVAARCVEAAIAYAVREKNMIVSAAAGNCLDPVVFPAAFPECLAIGGCGIDANATPPRDHPWPSSSRGPAVVVSAPAENVWTAAFNKDGDPLVVPGEGTSFATPHVAALAAHWLQRNGRQSLLDSFAGVPLQHVYRTLLRQTARVPQGWDTSNFGAGIIDAGALVCAEQPDVPVPQPWRPAPFIVLIFRSLPVLNISLEQFESYLENLLDVEPEQLGDWLESYGEELVRAIFETPSATAAFVENVETWQAAAAEGAAAAASHAETVVNEVRDRVSNTLKSAAGWIG